MSRSRSLRKSLGAEDDKENISEMIQLLRDYERICISKQDFSLAEEAKNKIELLKGQSLILRKEQL